MSRNKDILIVDGYNIINAWPNLEEIKKHDLESAREKLIEILADYAAQMGITPIVVFDAHQVEKNYGASYNINGVEVVFTREGETADHYIEKLAHLLGHEENLKVATSDWIEQQIVLGRGATRISARELYNEISSMVEKRRKKLMQKIGEVDTLGDRIDPKIKQILEDKLRYDNNS
jgi:predicted RNA-binding protein with PIN domain